jgi:hypothetical protein
MSEASNKQIDASTDKLLKRIRKCEKKIENLKTLPYYTVFNQRAQQEKDIAKAEKKLFKLQGKLMRGFDSFVDSQLHSNTQCSYK